MAAPAESVEVPALSIRLALALFGLLLATACGVAQTASTPTPSPAAVTETPAPTPPAPTSTPTATPTPSATPTPPPLPARCLDGGERLEARLAALEAEVVAAMDGYEGEWALSLIDLDCGVEMNVHPEYIQYTASAGKIVPIVAVLREVQAGEIALADIEESLLAVLRHSLDADATLLNQMVTPEQVAQVLEDAGVSEATTFPHMWNQALMPARDLALVWAALLRGELLDAERTEYLLGLAQEAQVPPEYETFPAPASADIPGYVLGQKAGYYVSDGVPYFLLGAGYFRQAEPPDGVPNEGVAVVFMMRTTNPDLLDPQRRSVFPLLVDYLVASDAS